MRHIIGRSVRPHGWMEPPEPIKERQAAYKRKLKEEEARRRLKGNPKQAEEDNKCIISFIYIILFLLCWYVPGLGAFVIIITIIIGVILFIFG